MKNKIIKNLYKKEMLDVLRDKKTVIMMLVVPLILYPLIFFVALQVMSGISSNMEQHTYVIGCDFDDDGALTEQFEMAKEDGKNFELLNENISMDMLSEEKIDIYITREEAVGKPVFKVYYVSSITNSSYALDMVNSVLDSYSKAITTGLLEQAGLDSEEVLAPVEIETVDIASNEESAGSLLGSIIPFMLIISLIMGTMYPAIDTTAGERERGTLETLLTLPVTNKQLIVSKFLAVATIGIISALLNIISMGGIGIYLFNMVASLTESRANMDVSKFVPAIIVCVLCIFAFAVFISAITMCVCAFAKSYKEANNYITPLMLVVLLASYVGFIPNVELTAKMALVPVANIVLLIKNLLAFKFEFKIIMLVLLSNIIYGELAIAVLSRIYNSESILFGSDGTGVQLFERRSNIVRGKVPTMGDAWMVAAIVFVAIIYAGSGIALKLGYYGNFASQLLILVIPLLAACYSKRDLKATYRIRKCEAKYYAAAIPAIFGALLVGMAVTAIVGTVFPQSAYNVSGMTDSLMGKNFFITAVMVALAPAVCEELMFRGFLFTAFETKMKHMNAILLVSVMFGLYHMSIVRFFGTAIIGFVICCFSYKSKSIFPGMLMHFINNMLSVISMYYPEKLAKLLPFLTMESYSVSDIMLMLGMGIVLLYATSGFINLKSKKGTA